MRYFALLSSLGYVLAGCGVSSAERPLATDDDRARTIEYIDSVNAAYSAARHKGDAASAAQMYAENAIFMRPGAHDLQGRAAIEAEIATWGAEVEGRAARDTIFVHGDRAYEVARGSWHDPKTGNRAYGKWVIFWAKQPDGTWRVERDLTVEDKPAPADSVN